MKPAKKQQKEDEDSYLTNLEIQMKQKPVYRELQMPEKKRKDI